MATYLDRIIEAHRRAAAADGRDPDQLLARACQAPPARAFAAALSSPGLAVIAEVKRRSPSAGSLADDVDPAALARAYAEGGAVCVSVLTDAEFFGGSAQDLSVARAAVTLPVLRKDFTVSVADVCDARLIGADAVLLIVAALSDAELKSFVETARAVGIDALVEVHDEHELERALAAGGSLIGVNQRDLSSFEVDTDRAVRVASAIPTGVISVAESGIRSPEDARRLYDAGYDAILVGEMLMRAADPAATLGALRSAAPAPVGRS